MALDLTETKPLASRKIAKSRLDHADSPRCCQLNASAMMER